MWEVGFDDVMLHIFSRVVKLLGILPKLRHWLKTRLRLKTLADLQALLGALSFFFEVQNLRSFFSDPFSLRIQQPVKAEDVMDEWQQEMKEEEQPQATFGYYLYLERYFWVRVIWRVIWRVI